MIREYELTVITRGDMADADHFKIAEKYEEIFKRKGGTIIHRDDWGVKKLSFPIDRQYRGRYFIYDIATEPENIAEAERLMRIDEGVLRYMSVRLSDRVDVEKRREELAKARLRPKVEEPANDNFN